VNLKVLVEGFYFPIFNQMTRKDTFQLFLREVTSPYNIIDTATAAVDSITAVGLFNFKNALSGTYYIIIKHFNCLETWSKTGGKELSYDSLIFNYNFTSSASQAFGNNLKLKGNKYCMISGDIDQDGIIDVSDFAEIDNGTYAILSGRFIPADLNGDNVVDLDDMQICENNLSKYAITP